MKKKNKKKIFLISFTIIMVFISAIITLAKTTKSYKEWYKDEFGVYPDGGPAEWRYDPVYSAYLNEIGETGYNNDVDGTVATTKKQRSYDERYYPRIDDTYWSGQTAKWSVDGYASKYQVTLYRDGSKVVTKTTTSRSQSFSSYMSRGENEYFFQVRAYNKDTQWWSDWEESDSKIVRGSDPFNPSDIEPNPGPGVVVPNRNPGQPPVSQAGVGQWVQFNGLWYFKYSNGTYATNTWLQLNGKWYYFNVNSQMVTGWLTLDGKTYFLNPDGTMLTGTVIMDGITHFFNQDGSMVY